MSNAPPMSSLRSYARPTFLPMLVLCRYYAASNVVPMLLKRPRCLDPTLSLGASQCSLLSPHPSYVFSLCSSYGPPMLLQWPPYAPPMAPLCSSYASLSIRVSFLGAPLFSLCSSSTSPVFSYIPPMLLLCSPYADVQYTPHGDRASPRRDHFFQ